MLRWLILAITFAVWVLCMLAVYAHCKPPPIQEPTRGLEAGLEPLFNEEPRRVWDVRVDLRRLKQDANPEAAAPWTGENEAQLARVGWLETTLKKAEGGESRLDQSTEADFSIPAEAGLPLLQMLGHLHYKSRSDISRDNGLEVFDAVFTLGLAGLEVRTHGVRDGGDLQVTQQIFRQGDNHKEEKLMDERTTIPVGKRGTPLVELFPFQRHADVREGHSWDIVMLKASIDDLLSKAPPVLLPISVTCTGRQEIIYEGKPHTAYTVSSRDGKARAWYSPDGVVLKQAFALAAELELIIVRVDAKKFHKPVWSRW